MKPRMLNTKPAFTGGDARLNSDYDLLILVDESSAELRDRILDLQVEMLDRHDALVATLLRTEDEW